MSDRPGLDVAVVPVLAKTRAPAAVTVVIDVLRASTSIVAALENGAARVIPAGELDEARALRDRLDGGALLAGERRMQRVPGFDLDNSPASFGAERVHGRTIVMSTTNGTRALQVAARGGGLVVCGAFVNRAAVARLLAQRAEDALLICAGNDGALSFDDLLAAGAIADGLLRLGPRPALSDAARTALALWQAHGEQLETALAATTHAQALRRAGFGDDVARCARLDVSACVPHLVGGVLTPFA